MLLRFAPLSLLCCLALLASQAAWGDPPKADARPRTDRNGYPLPPGAIARMGGTVRLGHGSPVLALAFSPDGKTVAAGGGERNCGT
jgi:hypothetical protein